MPAILTEGSKGTSFVGENTPDQASRWLSKEVSAEGRGIHLLDQVGISGENEPAGWDL